MLLSSSPLAKKTHLPCLKHHSDSRHSAANNAEKSRSMSWTCLPGVTDVGGEGVQLECMVRPTTVTQEALQEQSQGSCPIAPQGVREGRRQWPTCQPCPQPQAQAGRPKAWLCSTAPTLGAFPTLYQDMATFDVTSTRRSPSNTCAPSTARSMQEQDFVFLYLPLTSGMPLGFPGIEEVVAGIHLSVYTYTHTYTQFSLLRNNHCRTGLVCF